jgi:hypothetical protein
MPEHDEPTLFDLPAQPDVPVASTAGRGRPRERYRRTVTAQVRVVRPAVLRERALADLDGGVLIDLGPAREDDGDIPGTHEQIAESAAGALEWLIDPTAGLWPLLEADAFVVESAEVSLEELSDLDHVASWTVQVKLRDVDTLRRLAAEAAPQAAAEIERDLAVAWNHAADPYTPMTVVPGITWQPTEVSVERVYARR